jgi:very-short-patch-repair endonuclease
VLIVKKFTSSKKLIGKKQYKYAKKDFLLSRAEHEFYDMLLLAVENQYHIFPQVHLSTIINYKIVGQNWRAAFRHINEKSVDFVLCDKKYIKPVLAIELDDKTHEREDRKERDIEVERILEESGLPLLRIENHGHFELADIKMRIMEKTNQEIV